MSQQALVVIDLQDGFFKMKPEISNGDALLATANNLISNARDSGIPVFYIQHVQPSENAEDPEVAIHPALDKRDHDKVIVKSRPDAFHETTLEAELREAGIRDLIVTGLQTEFCVDTSCRRASSLGFNVILVKDGHSTWDTEELTAQQIINHHNRVLGDWFADVRPSNEIQFSAANT